MGSGLSYEAQHRRGIGGGRIFWGDFFWIFLGGKFVWVNVFGGEERDGGCLCV